MQPMHPRPRPLANLILGSATAMALAVRPLPCQQSGVVAEGWPRIESIDLSLDCTAPPRLRARARLALSGITTARVPLLLNRRLEIEAATGEGGRRFACTSERGLRSTYHREGRPVLVDLGAVPPDGRATIQLDYSGKGYDGSEGQDWRGILLLADDELRMSEQTIFYPQVPLGLEGPGVQACPARVRARVPAKLEVFVPGTPVGKAPAGEGVQEWRFELAEPGTLALLAVPAVRKEVERDGARVVTLLFEEHASLAEPFAEAALAVLDRYVARFGPAGGSTLGIVEFRGRGASYNWAQQGVVTFERGALSRDVPLATLAHEIAHLWWGQTVHGRGRGERFLTESLAEYSSWGFVAGARGTNEADELVRAARRTWLEAAHGNALDPALAEVEFATKGYSAMAYAKGPLVLLHAERVLGAAAMDRALRAYAAAGKEEGGTLAELLAALAAENEGEPLVLPWLDQGGHAHLALADVGYDEKTGRLRGRVRARPCQHGVAELLPPWVEVDVRAPEHRQRVRVPLGTTGAFELDFPAAPEWVGLDEVGCGYVADQPAVRLGGAQLVGSEPAHGAIEVPLGALVMRLRFDRTLAPLPPDAARKVGRTVLDAARAAGRGHLSVRAASLADGGEVLVLALDDTRPAQTYLVSLPSTLEDARGIPLPDVRIEFTTRSAEELEPPRVVETSPAVGARDVPVDVKLIRAVFSTPMRASTGFKGYDVRAQQALGRLYPPLEFGEWVDDRTLEFRVKEPLAAGTAYALPFGERYVDRRGLACAPFVLHFETAK